MVLSPEPCGSWKEPPSLPTPILICGKIRNQQCFYTYSTEKRAPDSLTVQHPQNGLHGAILMVVKKWVMQFIWFLSFPPLGSQHFFWALGKWICQYASKQSNYFEISGVVYRYTQVQDIIFYIHIFPRQAYGLRPESPAFISNSTVLSQKSTYNPGAAELQTSQDSRSPNERWNMSVRKRIWKF